MNQIVTYLMWPVFILVSWIIIKSSLILYERKFPEEEKEKEV